ncbi:DUF2069 domain-containing protein [Colwellia sp. 4_MG-2023]|jgi:uncharacterized membrane protein|uniref:DUF2069 domain-containing protein n=1 Tax=unclassified Colwellia TaxID=196834 RepID=UPI001C096069|nr:MULTISPECIES: DUF2069 domain-containing protein [unclassified Colwellia]MBU2924684.1 DUF2069 domain-containing protein [Colwellia sp. C2M11]MDO6507010.1 DUF2069 domain-containing protein [Colwellia sp. 5_MG-2023]MDO6555944.1 DUF2069 domain-containing protein [Colwellia sp. 4_MG-2023]MDO6653520.1 DUF2069 domain-containing protein [Colwellia sp. 3_MG-2023]MDO6666379.1 DUF2069 domain-containing protein [Colwellia sp. 2_MG-2023]
MKTQKISTPNLRKLALFGYFSLLIFMPLWLLVLSPSESLSALTTFLLFILPLLFPMKGILQGNPFTHAWANFIVLIYFLHSLTTLWVLPSDRIWALLELIFASTMFLGCSYYAKYKGQELGLSIRKPKTDKAD